MIYRIIKWGDYQHYKDRSPPWIKLHHSLLTSEVWIMSNDSGRALIIASMLLASRNEANDGTFNGDPEYVKRFAYLNSKPDFKSLIQYGFIELVQDASMMLAKCNTEERRGEKSRTEERERTLARFIPPSRDDVRLYCSQRSNNIDPDTFIDHYTSNGWKVGRNPMKDWKAAIRTWEKKSNGNRYENDNRSRAKRHSDKLDEIARRDIDENGFTTFVGKRDI